MRKTDIVSAIAELIVYWGKQVKRKYTKQIT